MKWSLRKTARAVSSLSKAHAFVPVSALAICSAFGAPGAYAQPLSAFGCSGLETRQNLPSIEGRNGVFFRVHPDLHNHQAFSGLNPQSYRLLARLSDALEASGTTLIYVPVPTKSLAMANALPETSEIFGYDRDIAATNYDKAVEVARALGIRVVNARQVLVHAATQGVATHFATDPRMAPDGLKLLAQAISSEIRNTAEYPGLTKVPFRTEPGGETELSSAARFLRQRNCRQTLPAVRATTYVTTRALSGSAEADTTSSNAPVTLVGTENTGEIDLNLHGFLAEETGLDVSNSSVRKGGAFGAVSAYLTSDEFRSSRPRYLIWANPVWHGLAEFGDQPMQELISAVGNACRIDIPVFHGADPSVVQAKLNSLEAGQIYTLALDTGGASSLSAQFRFKATDGVVRSRSVYRRQMPTERFFIPLTGLEETPPQEVEIKLDTAFGATPRLTACFQ